MPYFAVHSGTARPLRPPFQLEHLFGLQALIWTLHCVLVSEEIHTTERTRSRIWPSPRPSPELGTAAITQNESCSFINMIIFRNWLYCSIRTHIESGQSHTSQNIFFPPLMFAGRFMNGQSIKTCPRVVLGGTSSINSHADSELI